MAESNVLTEVGHDELGGADGDLAGAAQQMEK
jgi:hypothetical protein